MCPCLYLAGEITKRPVLSDWLCIEQPEPNPKKNKNSFKQMINCGRKTCCKEKMSNKSTRSCGPWAVFWSFYMKATKENWKSHYENVQAVQCRWKRQCIYSLLFNLWLFQSAIITATLVRLLLWAHAQISLCAVASAASRNITGGSRSVYYWGWPAHVSHDTFSGVQVRDGETVCFSLLLPLRCCFTLGGQTGTPVSETHQACGLCPSCSIDVWNGSACHSS